MCMAYNFLLDYKDKNNNYKIFNSMKNLLFDIIDNIQKKRNYIEVKKYDVSIYRSTLEKDCSKKYRIVMIINIVKNDNETYYFCFEQKYSSNDEKLLLTKLKINNFEQKLSFSENIELDTKDIIKLIQPGENNRCVVFEYEPNYNNKPQIKYLKFNDNTFY